jgi:hypothetical protein
MEDSSPIKIFRIFFGDEIFQIMWDETNLYTVQQKNKEQNNEEEKKALYLHRVYFFQVYMKGKPHDYGIKIFHLCETRSAIYATLEYMLSWITALYSVLSADPDRGILCIWINGFLSPNSSIIYVHIRQWPWPQLWPTE